MNTSDLVYFSEIVQCPSKLTKKRVTIFLVKVSSIIAQRIQKAAFLFRSTYSKDKIVRVDTHIKIRRHCDEIDLHIPPT